MLVILFGEVFPSRANPYYVLLLFCSLLTVSTTRQLKAVPGHLLATLVYPVRHHGGHDPSVRGRGRGEHHDQVETHQLAVQYHSPDTWTASSTLLPIDVVLGRLVGSSTRVTRWPTMFQYWLSNNRERARIVDCSWLCGC